MRIIQIKENCLFMVMHGKTKADHSPTRERERHRKRKRINRRQKEKEEQRKKERD